MFTHKHNQVDYPGVKVVVEAIADWITRYRGAIHGEKELSGIDPAEVAAIARDLGITAVELRTFASSGPKAADSLKKLLQALGVDPDKLQDIDPRIARDMQWLCLNCPNKAQCNHELSAGTAADTFGTFCPNAISINDVFDRKSGASR